MSTRSAIARVHGDGFLGVYHHWDGYPTVLGRTLWEFTRQYKLKNLLRLLIDDHPAGWSNLVDKDLQIPAGFQELSRILPGGQGKDKQKPECYCHGDRNEEAMPVDQDSDAGMEWAYVFDEEANTMAVLERVVNGHHMVGMVGYGADGQRWEIRQVVYLAGPEPHWERVKK